MPALEGERVYASYGSLFRTIITIGCAVWVFLMGSALPMVGDTRLGIIGFVCGILTASVVCLLSGAVVSFRYGVDCVDGSKPFLGVRGAMLPLAGLLLTAIGWAAVVMSMVARGVASLIAQWSVATAVTDKHLIVGLAFLILILCWALLRGGLRFVQRTSDFVGPGLLAFAIVSLALLVRKYGIHQLWTTNVPAASALTTDRRMSMAYAFEFGLTYSLVSWPYNGGLYRLVKNRGDAVGPFMTGTVVGGGFCSIIAALAAVNVGNADPLVWIVKLAGREVGTVLVCMILLLNIPAMCMLVYFAGVSVQQVRALARVRWSLLVTLLLVPLTLAAFNTGWVLTHIITLSTYGGLMFLGISVIAIVDYYFLRNQSIELEQVFVADKRGHYWFWGGVNWVAIAVVACGVVAYLNIYDPIDLHAARGFRYFGAALPMMVCTAVVYYTVMRLFVVRGMRGGYRTEVSTLPNHEDPVEVRL